MDFVINQQYTETKIRFTILFITSKLLFLCLAFHRIALHTLTKNNTCSVVKIFHDK